MLHVSYPCSTILSSLYRMLQKTESKHSRVNKHDVSRTFTRINSTQLWFQRKKKKESY